MKSRKKQQHTAKAPRTTNNPALSSPPRRWLFAGLLGFTAACTNLPTEPGVSLTDLQQDLADIRSTLDGADERLSELALRGSEEQVSTSEQLAALDKGLQRLPRRMAALCKAQEAKAAQQCEPQSTQVVVKSDDKMIVGELETLWVDPPGVHITARIDTGASSSSLHAANLVDFERDGDEWVRFDWTLKDQTLTIERPVLRWVKVVQQADPGGTRRPVVSLSLRIGDVADSFEFTLANRAHLEYQALLGRNFLTDVALVDVGRQFVQDKYEPPSAATAAAAARSSRGQ